ncbi:MAG: mechanosensitive ion channel protein MscS [Bacteroidetes bacterium HGW-Bacteroidetes-2]|jgi:small conductance mechanosensitive channel|nr:MAG: mechanosensitive ion channel protein MscS [Bacteroidetes bacterium HGW-Bacteroidetes-2]
MFTNFDLGNALEKLLEKLSGWGEDIILKVPNFILAILVFILFWNLGKYFSKFLKNILLKKVGQESVKSIISRTTFVLIVIIGFFVALGILDLDKILTSVLAGAGVIGLAIGLALQGTLNNTFSGVILSFLPNIQIGDWIETNNHEGRVVDINLRSVTILEADNNFVLIPNSKIIEAPFKNYSHTERSRVNITCGVGYESDLEFVKKITTDAILKIFPQNSNEEIEFFYTSFGDSSIDYVVRFWANAKDRKDILTVESNGILAIKKAYNENGINIPFPIRTLDFGKNKFRSETISILNKKEIEE